MNIDYYSASLKQISEYFRHISNITEKYTDKIEANIQKSKDSKYWDYPVSGQFTYVIPTYVTFYRNAIEELREIADEMILKLENHHFTRIETISSRAHEINKDIGDVWHNQYKRKEYGKDEFYIIERIYGDSRDLAVTVADVGTYLHRLEDFRGFVSSNYQEPNSIQTNKIDSRLTNWKFSLIVGICILVVAYLISLNVRYSVIASVLAFLIVFVIKPKSWFVRIALGCLTGISLLNAFAINLAGKYIFKSENDDLYIDVSITEPSIILSIILGVIALGAIYFEYKSEKN